MSRADHPAGSDLRCSFVDCDGTPAARVTVMPGVAVLRPADGTWGRLVCIPCAHHAVDVMLIRSSPEPADNKELPA